MFLFRTAFWLGVVVLVLPTDAQQQERIYKSVSSAAHQAATFCDRNQVTCQRGMEAWATFKQKLEFGVRVAIDVATERMHAKDERPGSVRGQMQRTDTLTPADLAPAWRGKAGQGA